MTDQVELTPRSSERLRDKSRKVFHMPKRDEILGQIEVDKTPSKGYNHLRPRKLVSSFVKGHNRYNNLDPMSLWDEDYLSDFISDEDTTSEDGESSDVDEKSSDNVSSSDESEEDEQPTPKRRSARIKKCRKRRRNSNQISDDDSNSDAVNNDGSSDDEENDDVGTDSMTRKRRSTMIDSDDETVKCSRTKRRGLVLRDGDEEEDANSHGSDHDDASDNVATCRAKKRNGCGVSPKSDGKDDDDDDVIKSARRRKKSVILDSDDEEVDKRSLRKRKK